MSKKTRRAGKNNNLDSKLLQKETELYKLRQKDTFSMEEIKEFQELREEVKELQVKKGFNPRSWKK